MVERFAKDSSVRMGSIVSFGAGWMTNATICDEKGRFCDGRPSVNSLFSGGVFGVRV